MHISSRASWDGTYDLRFFPNMPDELFPVK